MKVVSRERLASHTVWLVASIGQRVQRRITRSHDEAMPIAISLIEQAFVAQARQQASSHERRFAAAAGSDHSQETMLFQQRKHFEHLFVTTKEQVRFVWLEWSEARVGILWFGRLGAGHAWPVFCINSLTKPETAAVSPSLMMCTFLRARGRMAFCGSSGLFQNQAPNARRLRTP